MLEACGRIPETGMASQHNPVLAIQGQGSKLIITRFCAEMESLAIFILLAIVLYFSYLPRSTFRTLAGGCPLRPAAALRTQCDPACNSGRDCR